MRRSAFIGRFQPFHKGHEWLIRQKLDKGIPALILVRDIPPDDKNPFTTEETVDMIKAAFPSEDVKVQVIPDIESINWGRGVGYETNEFKPPEDIKRTSATDIRRRIKAKDDSWESYVNPHVAKWLKKYYKIRSQGKCIWLTGLSGSGKTTIALKLIQKLKQLGVQTEYLDGDVVRSSFCKDLGFTKEDRDENISRVSYVASYCSQRATTVCAFISPYRKARQKVKSLCKDYIEVFVDCPLEVCEKRDVKGLYAKARAGEIKGFTGIDDPYETPENPDIWLRTDKMNVDECVDLILKYLDEH